MKQPYVSTLIEQDFSDEEKSLARDNIAAMSSADLGPYATKTWVSDNFLSDGDFSEFATHEEVASATSGKMDATESSAFYPRYDNPEGYMKGLFEAEYGVTSYAAIKNAADNNKIVYCKLPQISGDRKALLTYESHGRDAGYSFEFKYYRSNSNVSGSDSIFVYRVNSNNVWTTEQMVAGNVSDWNATSGKTRIINKPDLSIYATEQWVNDQNYITSADVPTPIEYSAGPNISIYNDIISTEKTVVTAGPGVSIRSYQEPQTRTTTYEVSSSGATYTAGQYISISQNNVITASGLQPELPPHPGDKYLVGTDYGIYWLDRNKFMYISGLGNHVVTQEDLNNGYCDIPINWNLPSTARVNYFSFCMDLSDAYITVGGGNYNGLDGRVDKIKCSIYNEGVNTWYSNDNAHPSDPNGMIFEDILGSDLSRVTSYWSLNKIIKRAGMSCPYAIDFSGPSFRIVFSQGHDIVVGNTITLTGRISGIDFKNGGW
jgi:hypothetical protein